MALRIVFYKQNLKHTLTNFYMQYRQHELELHPLQWPKYEHSRIKQPIRSRKILS